MGLRQYSETLTTLNRSLLSCSAAANTSLWINRALEVLWLVTIVLVPLAFLDRDYVFSEAVTSYVEVPKIALLRTLVALMAVLWLIEWAIKGNLASGSWISGRDSRFLSTYWLSRLRGWLREHPSRWLFVAVWFFLGSTLLSTVLSGSFSVSLWGEVPGQDGYPAYTVIAYVLLFAVIATHVKNKAQVWRLIGAIVTMGTLVSGYAIFQHYGHDFLNLTEQTGGGRGESTAIMGNSLFAGATMMMAVPITVAAATLSVGNRLGTLVWSKENLRPFLIGLAVTGLWTAVLTVQLLGITFTFARGPWVGMVAALAGFLGLAALIAGWRVFAHAAVILGLTVVLGAALLHGLGSISILGLGPWLGVIIALGGFLSLTFAYADWRIFSKAVLGIGLAVTLAAGIFLAVSWFKGDDPSAGLDSTSPEEGAQTTAGAVAERFSSIRGEVLGGFATGRGTHWSVSWQLIKDRPWFDFDDLSIPWIRPLVGYGPDLFRYTYLLESRAEGPKLLPLEPDHAHNFFIHQTVEQGILGLLSSLGIFVAAFGASGYLLIRKRAQLSLFQKLILAALLATVAGRFLEMMVGVARVSDLTLFWVSLGALAALAASSLAGPDRPPLTEAVEERPPTRRPQRRRTRPQAEALSGERRYNWGLLLRLSMVAWLVGGIVILTWVKNVNNVRAAVEVGEAIERFKEGDYQAALSELDSAIELAPDISVYYNHKASVYVAYHVNTRIRPEEECSARADVPYTFCLANQAHESNKNGVERRPFYYRSRLALAHSAYNLRSKDVIRHYEEVLATVPDSWKLRDDLAEVYLDAGQAEAALKATEESIAITADSDLSAEAYFFQGKAHGALGDLEKSAASLERSLELGLIEDLGLEATQLLAEAYVRLELPEPAARLFFNLGDLYWSRVRREQATASVGTVPSGGSNEEGDEVPVEVVTQSIDDLVKSAASLERSLELGLPGEKELRARQILSESYLRLGDNAMAAESLFRLGEAYQDDGQLTESAQAFERSIKVATSISLASQARQALVEVYTALGRTDEAEKHRQ